MKRIMEEEIQRKLYKEFKPIRNKYRKASLEDIFYIAWAYNNALHGLKALPSDIPFLFESGAKTSSAQNWKFVSPWDIDNFIQFGLRHSSLIDTKFSFKHGSHLEDVIWRNRELGEKVYNLLHTNIDSYLMRLVVQQLQYQSHVHINAFIRYYAIYQHIETEIKGIYGISLRKIYIIGMVFSGLFLDKHKYNKDTLKNNLDGITDEDIEKFYQIFCVRVEVLKEKILESPEIDESYGMRLNPLCYYPLVELHGFIYAPSWFFLLERLTFQLKQDFNKHPELTHILGDEFEKYAREYAKKANPDNIVSVSGDDEFLFKHNTNHTLDILIADENVHLFGEAKHRDWISKAVRESGTGYKILAKNLAEVLADSYSNLEYYRQNAYPSLPYDAQIKKRLLIISQSDIFIFTEGFKKELMKELEEELKKKSTPLNIVNEIPFMFCRIDIWEYLCQMIGQKGLRYVLENNISEENPNVVSLKNGSEYRLVELNKMLGFEDDIVQMLVKEMKGLSGS